MASTHAFAEKVALVAGGSCPIGRAVSLQLALLGAFVVIVDVPGSGHDRAVDELASLGTLAANIDADVSTVDGADAAVAAVDKLFGRIDLLVNCLKAPAESAFLDIEEGELDRSLRDSVKTPFLLLRAAFRLLESRPKARIVNVFPPRSVAARSPVYDAARAAVEALTESLAGELPEHFRINTVAVDDICESVNDGLIERRTGIPSDDVARAVLFLLSGEAVGINGRTIPVRGMKSRNY
jgi:NAD(P)-dependent dehydrogenase (short-subunit alcohol dehydrogenase family)